MPSGRTFATIAAAALACVVVTALPATADDYPRVLHVDASRWPEISTIVIVPPLLSGIALPASAFSVTEGGRSDEVTRIEQLSTTSLRVVLVVDTAVSPDTLVAQQGAVRELLIRLPPAAQAAVISSGAVPAVVSPLSADRTAATGAVMNIEPTTDAPIDHISPALGLALTQLKEPGPLDAVIAVDAEPVAQTVPQELSRASSAGGAAVYALTLDDPPVGYLSGLPVGTGGRVVRGEPTSLVRAFDTVADELAGHYRVDFSSPGEDSHVVALTVSSSGIDGTTTFIVEPPAPKKVPGPKRDRLPFTIAAGVLSLAVLSLLFRLRGRRSH